jgi:predicted transcriptional regulator
MPNVKNSSALSLETLVFALSDQARWRLLAELASGEGRMIMELARRIGRSTNATTKHLQALTKAGILIKRNRLYQLAESFRPAAGSREIDLGACVIRLDGF